ncbi:putative mannan endo-1,6-alpha-mannosidase [Glarea lozoyensis 74030]|uniref:Putative mannan endo-1,6-alpha-mannosidase n=1 Tax=Glarea lozoyensis (strain ATCC 74030 / MF5533) TaxID=1104152 RepID=H0EFE0_GLAL7|nr:putative mannan endo-1,6-alpha-mannosidase [Glarea lozoyensis 74030]
MIASGGLDGTVRIWVDTDEEETIGALKLEDEAAVNGYALDINEAGVNGDGMGGVTYENGAFGFEHDTPRDDMSVDGGGSSDKEQPEAQKFNLGTLKVVKADFNIETMSGPPALADINTLAQTNPKGFLNDYYDDEGWWALGWIQAFDVTQNEEYLDTAVDIFNDMAKGATTPCGNQNQPIWWDKKKTYVNAIANELYLSVASHLANRIPSNGTYLTSAQNQWKWFQESGLINAQNTINDGLTTACKNNNGTVWSYNQGVILGALVELSKATGNPSLLDTAATIATAAIKALSDEDGILHDVCEPNCGADGAQFKGVFMRNLRLLQNEAPDDEIEKFIGANAASIWKAQH